MPTHSLTLDVHKRTSRIMQQVVARQGEDGTEVIQASLVNDGAPYTPSLASARLDILHADGTWARVPATRSGSTVTCTLPSAALSSPGICRLAHFVLSGSGKVEATEGFELRILPAVDTAGTPGAKDYDDAMDKLYAKWSALEDRAEEGEEARRSAEDDRISAESERASAEKSRAQAEALRSQAEQARIAAESARAAAEQERAAAEQLRDQAEQARIAAEEAREAAESARAAAEAVRATDQAKNNADQAANNAAAQGLQVTILAAGQYDPDTLEPTGTGNAGRLYFVPSGAEGDDEYVEWMYIDGAWERVGMSNATIESVTTDQIDAVVADQGGTGEQVLNLTGLAYFWAKLKAWASGAFAAIAHKHNGTDINAATLPRTAIDSAFEAEIASLESSRDSVSQKWTFGTGVVNASLQNPNANTQSGKQIGIQLTYADGERMLLYTDYDLGICLYNHTTSSRVYLIPRKRLLYSGSSQITSGHTLTIDKQAWLSKCNRVLVCGWVGSGGCRFSYELPTGNCNILAAGIDSGSALVAARINVNTTGEQVVITNSGVANVGAPPVVISQVYAWYD